ncbi:MAG: sel1 repeat family protein [Clostridia bacterium]|nr:sel1 repeat family protein [Clostridia bacterium]
MEDKTKKDIDFDIKKNEIQSLIEQDKFEEVIEKLEDNEIDFETLSKEDKGEAYYSLGKILSHDKKNSDYEKSIIDDYQIEKDLKKAVICYWHALNYDNTNTPRKLFSIYMSDDYGFKDEDMAFKICVYGINIKDPKSYFNLGKLYYHGFYRKEGYEFYYVQDRNEAKKLFEESVQINPRWGGYELGCMYEHGECGCPTNYKKAFNYYRDAADYGDKLAMFKVACIYGTKDEKQNFQNVQFNKDLSIKYFENHLKQVKSDKRSHSITSIGVLKYENAESQKEKIDGIKNIIRGAKKGNDWAQRYLKNNNIGSVDEPEKFDLSFMEK